MDSSIADLAPCGLLELDADEVIVGANQRIAEWVGAEAADLIGRRLDEFVEDPSSEHIVDDRRTAPEGARSVTVRLVHTDGSSRPVLISWRRDDDRTVVVLFDATLREAYETRITQEHTLVARQERRLNLLLRSAVRFADALEVAELGEILAEVAQDAYAATSAAVLLADDEGTIATMAGSAALATDLAAAVPSGDDDAIGSVRTFSDISEADDLPAETVRYLTAEGVRGMLVAPIVHANKRQGLLAVFFDAVRHFDSEAAPLAEALIRQAGQALARIDLTGQLQRNAMLDVITGLPNRRLFEEQVHRAAESDELVAVAFIDLDGFKAVNDTLGHDAGDRILREVAHRIQAVVREQDSVARFGGDEFVAVWTVHAESDAGTVAERIRESVALPYDLPGGLRISASIGLAVSRVRPEPQVADRLVRLADQAMYRAKSDGGNRFVLSTV